MTSATSNYADDVLVGISDAGMTDDLWQLAYNDVGKLGKLLIRNDRERNLLFHLENFVDDLCEEFGYTKSENSDEVVSTAFNMLRNKKDIGLADIREAVFWTLENASVHKVAYPNINGVNEGNRRPFRDVDKWVKTLGNIYTMMQAGHERDASSKQVLEGWDPMEKLDFEAWARYYEKNDHEKYQIKRSATAIIPPLQAPNVENQVGVAPVLEPPKSLGRPRQTERTPESIRKAFVSRLNSAEKLLYEYKEVWPASVLGKLYEYLAELKRMIFTLETKASMVDCIYKTAGQWDRSGFSEGAIYLRKIAQEPGEDIASQIEKALTGREYETKEETPPPAPTEEMASMPPGGEEAPPMPPGGEEMAPMPGGEEMAPMPPAGAGEELPPMEPPPPAPEPPKEMKNPKDNPFAGSNVQDVLEILEPMVQRLKAREEFRELSKVDMMLDAINIASHFPELTEAVSHLLETNNYVVTRLDKMVSKLKGGLKEDVKETKTTEKPAPSVEMGEFGATPPAPKEKEMFEVTEGEAPPPGPDLTTPPAPGV